MIDRGEPDSYFAIWDFIGYIGQGGILRDQCQLLREVWEEMALTNSAGTDQQLLNIVMRDYDVKRDMLRSSLER